VHVTDNIVPIKVTLGKRRISIRIKLLKEPNLSLFSTSLSYINWEVEHGNIFLNHSIEALWHTKEEFIL
jgi:hypothetical protein